MTTKNAMPTTKTQASSASGVGTEGIHEASGFPTQKKSQDRLLSEAK